MTSTSATRSHHSIAADWTRMWNREIPADGLVAPDALVHFGRTPPSPRPATTTGAAELQAVIDGIGAAVDGVVYAVQGDPVLDQEGRRITIVWSVGATELEPRTGIDILLVGDHGAIAEVWSVTGDIVLPPLR
jgi:uncharacterized membrane protein